MKKLPVTLADGETYVLSTPTFYFLQLMADNGVDLMSGAFVISPGTLSAILASLLTDSEPVEGGAPRKVWSAVEAAKLIPPDGFTQIADTVTVLIMDAYPQAEEDEPARPTEARVPEG